MLNQALTTLRAVAFLSLDALRGGWVKNSYEEIKKIDSLASDHAEVKKHQATQFRKLAEHAVNTTRFYKQFNRDASLDAFPVINKNKITSNQQDFLSDQYNPNTLIQMSTSGSTGTPFISYQDKHKKRRVHAEVIYYSGKAGYSVGKNLIFLRALTEETRKSSFKQWAQNESLIKIDKLKTENIESILAEIVRHSKNGSMLLAYSSTYDALHDYLQKNKMDALRKANITGAVGGAEMLYDHTRQGIEKAFGCRLYSRYSNQENGVIGQDHEKNNVFIINEANYIVEIFDLEKEELVPEGEVGRIVLTDLYNMAMPMIRYDTGDIGAITQTNYQGVQKNAISNFGGRRLDLVYDYEGNILSPGAIMVKLWSFSDIKQFQFVQETEESYTLKISSDAAFIRDAEIKETFRDLLGDESTITVEVVDEIPIMSSGKRKPIVSKLNT